LRRPFAFSGLAPKRTPVNTPSVVGRILASTAATGLLALCVAVTPSAGQSVAPPSGDPAGLAMLARVHRAYVAVPGVTLLGRAGSLSFRFTFALRSGVEAAEQVTVSTPNGTATFVARRDAATFVRHPGSSCWRRLPSSSAQTISSLGLPFPDQPHMRVKPPRRTRTGWLLPVAGDGGPATFAIDGKSMLIRSLTLASQGTRIVEYARTLASRPQLALPEPRC
jgi:hypothetical protein